MTMRRGWLVLLLLLAPLAQAASVRAFLDRSHVSLGDTVTLNIQSDGSLGTPDLSPLQRDFQVLGSSRSSNVSIVSGKATSTTQLGIALKPLHAGTLTIPALGVGSATTQALQLHVGAAPSGGGAVGDAVFMQAGVQPSSPYVGQQTVYTVRLFYLPDVSGALGDPSVDGARLVPLDRDHRYTTERNGYTYKVVERSWALLAQRAGVVSVQGPVFEGQRLGSGIPGAWFNDPNALLNSPLHGFGSPVRATAPVVQLDARAVPANAGKPWLPARDVQMDLTGLPTDGKVTAGSPLTVTLAIRATGQPAGALPEPELPVIAGARVYPDQTRDTNDGAGQWLQATRTRSFAIVPDRNGTLMIPAITLDWWNVSNDHAEQARVPAHTLVVSGVVASAPPAPAAPPAAAVAGSTGAAAAPVVSATAPAMGTGVQPDGWRNIALASLVLWLFMAVVAVWWWLRGRGVRSRAALPVTPSARQGGVAAADKPHALRERVHQAARRGDAAACEHALLAWARSIRPGVTSVGALREALDDDAQRDAIDAVQRVRWQGGDVTSACAAMRQAFAGDLAWRGDGVHARRGEVLPPLYAS